MNAQKSQLGLATVGIFHPGKGTGLQYIDARFGDLRFGPTGRYQLDIRGSWGFPVSWLADSQYVSLMVGFGARIF